MALTNRMLKTMGIEEDQRDQIMEAHQDTLREIKAERDGYRDEAEKVPDLQRQLREAQEAVEAASKGDGEAEEWRQKFEAERKALEDYRAEVAAAEGERAKAEAYRGLLVKAGVDPKRLDSVMRVTDLSKVEVGEDGGIKDADELAKAAAEEWADFVVVRRSEGAGTETPPAGSGSRGPDGVSDIAAEVIREHNERMYGAKSEE